jgi:hypothetical protein
MKLLLDITWSRDGAHLRGTLRSVEQDVDVPFSGTLELVARLEELLTNDE